MKNRFVRFMFLFPVFAFAVSMVTLTGVQQAQVELIIDSEGESSVGYTLEYAGGDPIPDAVHGVYVLEDESVVAAVSGSVSTNQRARYRIDADTASNTYTTTLLSSSTITPQELPPIYAASVAQYTVKKDNDRDQVKTINVLKWRIVNGTVGYTCYADLYQVFPSSATGGLIWNITKSPVDAPYTTSASAQNLINDTGNGKYKNFNFQDPNLSTVAVHFVRIQKEITDPDHVSRYSLSHKMKNEGKNKFRGEFELNADIPLGATTCQ